MRLFFAVPLSPSLAARIAGWRDTLRLPRVAAPVLASNMHITLAFLGNVPCEQVPALLRLGARVAAREARGELVLDRVHCWRNGVLHLAPSPKEDERARLARQRSNPAPPIKTPPSLNRFKSLSISSHPDGSTPSPTTSTPAIYRGSTGRTFPVSPGSSTSNEPPSPSTTETTLTSVSSTSSIDNPPDQLSVHALAAALRAELEAEGVHFDDREFSAHLTLARRAAHVRGRARFRVPITSLVLYVSRTDGRHVAYTALGEWPLTREGSQRMTGEKWRRTQEKGRIVAREGKGEKMGIVNDVVQVGGESRESHGHVLEGKAEEGSLLLTADFAGEVDTELSRILGIPESSATPVTGTSQ
ncbi:hypothetical protein CcaverHIS641_0204400 [Cutaneotrichosporon cavernicola]|nr:hypothetical protein CcaverHIS641_0204400 [Cutaneotrichosporon cavernicola]